MATVLVLHGPNLNLLGEREPGIYGEKTLESINMQLLALGGAVDINVTCVQSNAEHELIEHIHAAKALETEFILINPAAFTHTSVALRDALAATQIPFVEVHLSNVHAREEFRQHSFFSDIAQGVVSGLGAAGYEYAMQFALTHIKNSNKSIG